MSHYCRICGEWKSNESFSGRGHRSHICKACHKLPVEKRAEMEDINRICSLPFRLSKGNRAWLQKMKADPREAVRREAEAAWNVRFARPIREAAEEDEDEFWDEPDDESWTPDDFGPEPEYTGALQDVDPFELPF